MYDKKRNKNTQLKHKRKKKGERKVKISGTIKPEQERWIKDKIKQGKFYNISHILQEGIRLLQVQENS